MKIALLLTVLYGCSQLPVQNKKNTRENEILISLEATYDQIRSSYLKGCVDAFKYLHQSSAFDHCMEKAKDHEKEVREIVD